MQARSAAPAAPAPRHEEPRGAPQARRRHFWLLSWWLRQVPNLQLLLLPLFLLPPQPLLPMLPLLLFLLLALPWRRGGRRGWQRYPRHRSGQSLQTPLQTSQDQEPSSQPLARAESKKVLLLLVLLLLVLGWRRLPLPVQLCPSPPRSGVGAGLPTVPSCPPSS